MPPNVITQEATGQAPFANVDLDQRLAIFAPAVAGSLQPLEFGKATPVATEYTAGPLVRDAQHIVTKTRVPVVCVRTEATGTAAAYDTIDLTAFDGTAIPTPRTASVPYDEYVAYWRIAVGGNVGELGDEGEEIMYYESDDDGRTLSGIKRLGTATFLEIVGTNIVVDLLLPANALVAAATEIRADLLAHFADATAHNSADATAAALITASAPSTNTQAITVLNQCRLAYETSHRLNTTAHDSVDYVNTITVPAATTEIGARLLAIDLKAKINDHLDDTFPASAAALLVATATTVAVQEYDDTELINAGIDSLDEQPGKITFTTAGATPSDAPATATISGRSTAAAEDTETVNISQSAGLVTSTKSWYGTDLLVTYAAGDGTGATVSIGTAARVHNSADVTNVITGDDPAPATVLVDDVIRLPTIAAKWSEDELAEAFTRLAQDSKEVSMILVSGRTLPSEADTVIAGIESLSSLGKKCMAILQARKQGDAETEAQWVANVSNEWASITDSRLTVCAGDYWITYTNGQRTRVYARGFSAAYARRLVDKARGVAAWRVSDGPLEEVSIENSLGQLIGHDENILPGFDAARLVTLYRIPNPQFRRGAYISGDYVVRGDEERVFSARVRRIMNAMKRMVEAVGWGMVGQTFDVQVTGPDTGILAGPDGDAMAEKLARPVRNSFSNDISDYEASDLVVVNRNVTVAGDDIYVDVTINFTPKKALRRLTITFAIRVG